VHARDAALRTADGQVLIVTRGKVDPCMISRPDLLAALADGVDIRYGSTVDDPADHEAEVIIGADWTFSRTRLRTFGDHHQARSLGALAWRGTIPGMITDYGETWAPGALFGITPTGLDATNYYACIRADAPFPGRTSLGCGHCSATGPLGFSRCCSGSRRSRSCTTNCSRRRG
jgi:hypothetical protein